jgi:hypothetical protein
MSVLHERGLHAERSRDVAIRSAGGLWFALGSTEPADIVAEVRQRGIQGLEVQRRDISFLAELPDLEFLVLNTAEPDAVPINGLHRLRALAFNGGWKGRLDFANLPDLEWLFVAEVDLDRGIESLLTGHARVRDLSLGHYPAADLSAVANLPALERLEVVNSRRFTGMAGGPAVSPSLRQLVLARLPRLASLDGISALPNLEYVEIDSCSQVTDLGPLLGLTRLRFLTLRQPKGIPSLAPLAGHPSLEFVSFDKIGDGDLGPLLTMPRLRAISPGRYRYSFDPASLPLLDELPDDDPFRVELRMMAVG